MATLLDTHTLIWAVQGSPRLSRTARAIIEGPQPLLVSAVTAWEYADLRQRGRLPSPAAFAEVVRALAIELLDLPASLWTLADALPNIHGDPVDRMLIAHASHTGLTLLTADATIRSYPISTCW